MMNTNSVVKTLTKSRKIEQSTRNNAKEELKKQTSGFITTLNEMIEPTHMLPNTIMNAISVIIKHFGYKRKQLDETNFYHSQMVFMNKYVFQLVNTVVNRYQSLTWILMFSSYDTESELTHFSVRLYNTKSHDSKNAQNLNDFVNRFTSHVIDLHLIGIDTNQWLLVLLYHLSMQLDMENIREFETQNRIEGMIYTLGIVILKCLITMKLIYDTIQVKVNLANWYYQDWSIFDNPDMKNWNLFSLSIKVVILNNTLDLRKHLQNLIWLVSLKFKFISSDTIKIVEVALLTLIKVISCNNLEESHQSIDYMDREPDVAQTTWKSLDVNAIFNLVHLNIHFKFRKWASIEATLHQIQDYILSCMNQEVNSITTLVTGIDMVSKTFKTTFIGTLDHNSAMAAGDEFESIKRQLMIPRILILSSSQLVGLLHLIQKKYHLTELVTKALSFTQTRLNWFHHINSLLLGKAHLFYCHHMHQDHLLLIWNLKLEQNWWKELDLPTKW